MRKNIKNDGGDRHECMQQDIETITRSLHHGQEERLEISLLLFEHANFGVDAIKAVRILDTQTVDN